LATRDPASIPTVGQYVATFLKPEMLHIYRQITSLRAFRPVVFCQKRENSGAFPFEPVVTLPKPRTHQLRRLWQKQILGRPITIYRSEARRLASVLRDHDARLLHVFFGHIGVHLLPWLRMRSLPSIVSFHGADAQVGLDQPAHLRATREMLSLATLILARSESLAARLVALGCPAEKIRIHRTGLPLEQIPTSLRVPPTDGAWHLVQASRLIAKKGLPTTLKAFARFAQDLPKARLTIAGEGPMLEQLRTQAAGLGVSERVHFAGFLSQPELLKLYGTAHIFVHPSELGPDGDQEGVPNSMLEAMATGLPIVATRHGGIPEAVDDGVAGSLVAERDDLALANAMSRLASTGGLLQEFSAKACSSSRARFDLEAQRKVLEGYYEEAIKRFHESPRD
jgi:colanic acid/amylovoran biosynthesis glycosyltransferase